MGARLLNTPTFTRTTTSAGYTAALGTGGGSTKGSKLLLVVVARNSSNAAAITTPAGWTLDATGSNAVALGEQTLIKLFSIDNLTGTVSAPSIAGTWTSGHAIIFDYGGLLIGAVDTTGNAVVNATSGTMTATTGTNVEPRDFLFVAGCNTGTATATTWTYGGVAGLTAVQAYTFSTASGSGMAAVSLNAKGAVSPSITVASTNSRYAMVAGMYKIAPDEFEGILG